MTIRYSTIILLLLIPLHAEGPSKEPKYKPGLVDVGLDEKQLDDNLWIVTQDYGQQSGWSKQTCSIGYKELKDGGDDFIPVIKLPALENDIYVIILKNGVIHVSKAKAKSEVIAVDTALLRTSSEGVRGNLKKIEFGETSQKIGVQQEAEPPGPAQPATQPADKTPVKDQPSTPTSTDAPR
jgi:hypothetical protein